MKSGIFLLFLLLPTLAFCTYRERLLFNPQGLRIDLRTTPDYAGESRWISPRWARACPSPEIGICLRWKLYMAPDRRNAMTETQRQQLINNIQASFNVWTQAPGSAIRASFVGWYANAEIPYRMQGTTPVLDNFQNKILEDPDATAGSDILITFSPPTSVQFNDGELVRNLRYIVPNIPALTGETKFAVIAFNPIYSTFGSCNSQTSNCLSVDNTKPYSVRGVLVHELGRIYGLEDSPLEESLRYPLHPPSSQKNYTLLHPSDARALAAVYPNQEARHFGTLRGRIIEGTSGEGFAGGVVLAIPSDRAETFKENLSTGIATMVDMSADNGQFEFDSLPDGDYLLFSYNTAKLRQTPAQFGEWMKKNGNYGYFEPDFYDGRARESNLEGSAYSPRLIDLSARVSVRADTGTEPVEIITAAADGTERREAAGANFETLSDITLSDLQKILEDELNRDLNGGGGSGKKAAACGAIEGTTSSFLGLEVLLALALLLGLRARWGRQAK